MDVKSLHREKREVENWEWKEKLLIAKLSTKTVKEVLSEMRGITGYKVLSQMKEKGQVK